MPSPFPGMDPYLEDPANWSDFHSTFINYVREALLAVLPAHYTARVQERVTLVEGPRPTRPATPDVSVDLLPGPRAAPSAATAVATLAEPVTLPLPAVEEQRETFVEIQMRADRTLVTSLELLSPSNKEPPGRGLYLAKRNALLAREVSLVELDLLLGGQRLPLGEGVGLPAGDYHAFVARAGRRPDCDVYSWHLPDRLPALPVPVRAPDPDVVLDLAAVFALVYERGGYARVIDYARPPEVRLSDERLTWVAGVTNGG